MKALLVVVAVSSLFSACTPEHLYGSVYRPAVPTANRAERYVNSLPYSYRKMGPVIAAYEATAAARGWTAKEIASWRIAIGDIALKEAQGCWNVRYAAKFAHWDGRDCLLSRPGRGAAGYGQITKVLLPTTCEHAGLCSQNAIVASPWTSMNALLAVVEAHGVGPWCYDSFSRRFHRTACSNPGMDV